MKFKSYDDYVEWMEQAVFDIEMITQEYPHLPIPVDPDVADYMGAFEDPAFSLDFEPEPVFKEPLSSKFYHEMEEYTKRANAAMPARLADMLAAGVPIFYADEQGREVKEMPNGEIIILSEN